jgi:hypothetical protein
MKITILTLLVFIMLFSCDSSKRQTRQFKSNIDIIPYVIPSSVRNSLIKQMGVSGLSDQVYFFLKTDSNFYQIFICPETDDTNSYANRTNRKLFLNGKFYPLVFDLDQIFGTPETKDELLNQFRKNQFMKIRRSYSIYEGFSIKFNKDGDIISDTTTTAGHIIRSRVSTPGQQRSGTN